MHYYDMVVATARMMGKPAISFKEMSKALHRVADALGQKIDESELKTAYAEFSQAHLSRAYA